MKRIVSWMFGLMLVFTMITTLSAAVHAEDRDSSPAISIGAGNIEKGNKIYMGVWPVNSNLCPVSWIVLGAANSETLKSGDTSIDAEKARLLITEMIQGDIEFDPEGQNNVWQGSNIQSWCVGEFLNGFEWTGDRYQDYFSGLEKASMLYTSKEDEEYNLGGPSSLENDQIFLLSAEEVSDNYGYFNSRDSRIACSNDKGEPCYWWLRSPDRGFSDCAVNVSSFGDIIPNPVFSGFGVRPAFNINLNAILFTSSASGGKTSGAAGANALTEVSANPTNEWKLTFLDPSREFAAAAPEGAALIQDEGYDTWTIPVNYSGAYTGDNEYVSAILADSSDKALYYGHISNNTTASSDTGQEVNIPAGLAAGDYKLHVFSEQCNGDNVSDYASAFSTITLMVNAYPPAPDNPKTENTLKVKGRTAAVRYSKLRKKPQKLAASKVIRFEDKGQGKLSYTKASGNKKISINNTSGKVTVKKGLKKGKYKVKVKVKAAGNANYEASETKAVTLTIIVK